MEKTIGFIGFGNMGQAMAGAIIKSGIVNKENIIISKKSPLTGDLKNENLQIFKDNKEVATKADYLFLAVKPNIYKKVLEEIKDVIKDDAVIISMAAGLKLEFLKVNLDNNIKVVRIMPNTPALVGEGMTVYAVGSELSEEQHNDIKSIFGTFGRYREIDEKLIDPVSSISGCSPAYVYVMIEAMADGAVLEGVPRAMAYEFAAQAVLGSAKMVLETGVHPGELKDRVCSPGGTTIEAIAALEKNGFRHALIEAVKAATEKSRLLGK